MEQMYPAALGSHTLKNSEEERPIEKNWCALTNHPPEPTVSFMKGPNITCCDVRMESSGKRNPGEESCGKKVKLNLGKRAEDCIF